ncbi:MAG: AAA family ATPase [Acidithiobacillus sp.]
MPQLWIVAGPNGAGKTTLANEWLAASIPVVSPDSISADHGLSPIQAGRAAIREQERLLSTKASFAVDTTLSGNREIELMNRAKKEGYKTNLIFVGVLDVAVCLGRIKERAAAGGHDVPDEDVARRYDRSLANLASAIAKSDRAFVLDNSGKNTRLLFSVEQRRVRHLSRRIPAWARAAVPKKYWEPSRGLER